MGGNVCAQHYDVPEFIGVAVAPDSSNESPDKSGPTEMMKFSFEVKQERSGNMHRSVNMARQKMRKWAEKQTAAGKTVFVYTITSTVFQETVNSWDGNEGDG